MLILLVSLHDFNNFHKQIVPSYCILWYHFFTSDQSALGLQQQVFSALFLLGFLIEERQLMFFSELLLTHNIVLRTLTCVPMVKYEMLGLAVKYRLSDVREVLSYQGCCVVMFCTKRSVVMFYCFRLGSLHCSQVCIGSPRASPSPVSRLWQSSQSCQWLSPVTQTKLTKMHFQTRELVLASVAAFVTTPSFPPNLIIQWIEVG